MTTWSRIDAGVFEDIELLERGFAGDTGVREDRDVGRDVRATDRAKHFSLVLRDLIPRSDFSKGPDDIVVDLLDERFEKLILAHGRNLFRVPGLRVEPAADHDRHS